MIDAGRIQPTTVNSRRSQDPGAGRRAAQLAHRPAAWTRGGDDRHRRRAGARQLAAVQSAPLIERLSQMMNASDNVMAECIAREVAAAINRPQSFTGAVDAVTSRLNTAHVDTAGVDAGGLQRAVGRRPVDGQDARRRGAGRGGTGPAGRCGRCWTCCRSPAAAARWPNASSTGHQPGPGRLAARQDRLADRRQLAGRGASPTPAGGCSPSRSSPTTPGRTAATRWTRWPAKLWFCGCAHEPPHRS